jgi:membrane associated rhomboid family serine protease
MAAGGDEGPRASLGNLAGDMWRRIRGSVSLTIVFLCTAAFLALAVLDLVGLVPREPALTFLGLSYAGVFHRLWLHQFLTAPLLHANVVHLLFNMLTLWMLGPGVESILGRGRYVLFSIVCAVSSMCGFLVFNRSTNSIVIGYSGVIFGILVAQAVFFPEARVALYAFFQLKMKYAVLLLGAVELYLTISPEGAGIAHSAHLFGALAAYVYLRRPAWQKAVRGRTESPKPRPPVLKPSGRRTRKDIPREL